MTSYHTYFAFAAGLSEPITVPKGTLERCQSHVAGVESALGIETTKFRDNPPHWNTRRLGEGVSDEVFCERARAHNRWVRCFYEDLAKWSEAPPDGDVEQLTPDGAASFWQGLRLIGVPIERWTRDYYRDRMEHLYEVLRGRDSEGVSLCEKALTEQQAAAVIRLLAPYLDNEDIQLDVPNGCDRLASDGEYEWCEKCGPAEADGTDHCRRRGCPIREERLWRDLVELRHAKLSATQIGEWVGLSASTVRRRLRAMDRASESQRAGREAAAGGDS